MADASAVRAHLIDFAGQIFDKAVDTVFLELVDAAPERDGDTKRALKTTPLSSSPPFAAFVELPEGPNGPYGGEYVETGTVEHDIPGNPLLAFEWKGDFVIVHSVHKDAKAAEPWFHVTLEREWPRALADAASVAS